jgi:hypothetical protein
VPVLSPPVHSSPAEGERILGLDAGLLCLLFSLVAENRDITELAGNAIIELMRVLNPRFGRNARADCAARDKGELACGFEIAGITIATMSVFRS